MHTIIMQRCRQLFRAGGAIMIISVWRKSHSYGGTVRSRVLQHPEHPTSYTQLRIHQVTYMTGVKPWIDGDVRNM